MYLEVSHPGYYIAHRIINLVWMSELRLDTRTGHDCLDTLYFSVQHDSC